MNPKGRLGSQEDGGQSQIPAYPHFLVLSGHLTDSECNQKLTSKKGSLIERKRSSGRVRRKGDEPQASGYHSEGKPLCTVCLSSFTLANCVILHTGFTFLLSYVGVWVSMIILNICICLILCVFRRNTERETGS